MTRARVVFRADAATDIGTGHVVRCLTLADILAERGLSTHFIMREQPGALAGLVRARGHGVSMLPSVGEVRQAEADDPPHAGWLGVDWRRDAEECLAVLAEVGGADWLVVDHYALDARWESLVRAQARQVMVIDDLADRRHDCDLLLDQNLQEPGRYAGLVPPRCAALIGPKYALLRPQFATARQTMPARDGQMSRLLVFLGGCDVGGETLKAIAAIIDTGRTDLAVAVVVGQANPHRTAIEALCRNHANLTLLCQVEDMAAQMLAADLFVGAGGTSSWERCCLGLPALVWATAANQVGQGEALADAGAQLYLGPASSVTVARLSGLLAEMTCQPTLLRHMAGQASRLVDGHGAGRVASHLLAAMFTLRPAEFADSAAIHAWRNHPDTRRHAFDASEIGLDSHERWFAAVLADRNRELLVAEYDGQPIGVLRYDIEAGIGLVSIYLVPGLAGQGWGRSLLLAGERWLSKARPEVRILEAEIAADNRASLAVFQATGFQPYRWVLRKERYGSN